MKHTSNPMGNVWGEEKGKTYKTLKEF